MFLYTDKGFGGFTEMVPHIVPPGNEVRHDAVVLEPNELPQHIGTVQLVEDTEPDNAVFFVSGYRNRAVRHALLCPWGWHLCEPVWGGIIHR